MSYGLRGRRQAAVALVAATALVAGVLAPVPTAAADSGGDALRAQVQRLRTKADHASSALRKATKQYQDARRTHRSTQRSLIATAEREQHAQDRVDAARKTLVAYAISAFKSPLDGELSALLGGSLSSVASQRSTVDASYLSRNQARVVAGYNRTLSRRAALHRHAKALEKQTQRQQERLAAKRKQLQKRAKAVTHDLLRDLDRLIVRLARAGKYHAAFQVSRERMKRSGGDPGACDKPSVTNFPNGLIPTSMLCPLPERGEFLRADAARAFWLLDTAYRARFGHHICITDSYRPLAEQYSVYRRKPTLAAVPGTSRHGLGVAVDLGCGINTYGSTPFLWMKRHAPTYGWVHPAWAERNPFEPWHWEYVGRR